MHLQLFLSHTRAHTHTHTHTHTNIWYNISPKLLYYHYITLKNRFKYTYLRHKINKYNKNNRFCQI